MSKNTQVVTRMAPSPTGRFHVGGLRTALFNYAYAKQHGGTFIVRVEDTDTERNEAQYEQEIFDVLEWCGVDFDQKFLQSEHLGRHQELLKQMITDGHAYEAEESKDGSGKVIRFKNPNKSVTFQDEILGEITFDTTDLEDFVIARNIDSPLYHLAVVIDDHDEGVTHVIRAQEHLANTPRQILIHEALGFSLPTYAHVPFILGPDGKKKLSKRDGNVAVMDYKADGYLPEAMLNFLIMIGWNPGTDQEIFTKDEIISQFSLDHVQKGPAGYNIEKLDWINKEWLNKMSDTEFTQYVGEVMPAEQAEKILPLLRERIHNLKELREMIEVGEFQYFFDDPTYAEPEKIVWKQGTVDTTTTHLDSVARMIDTVDDWTTESIKESIWGYAEEHGKGDVLWPLRYALSGRDKSPDPIAIAAIIGKESVIRRINSAIQALS